MTSYDHTEMEDYEREFGAKLKFCSPPSTSLTCVADELGVSRQELYDFWLEEVKAGRIERPLCLGGASWDDPGVRIQVPLSRAAQLKEGFKRCQQSR